MFRHQGKSKTLKHNIHLATVLSFVAGLVNVTGFISFKQLTTNVTGHFALFVNLAQSQLLFPITKLKRNSIKAPIKLRVYIIGFFFLRGLAGGFFFSTMNLKLNTLLIGAAILLLSLFYDDFRFWYLTSKRRHVKKTALSKRAS
ncbi:MAG: hypothetical protein ACK5M1_11830 [Xanthomarina gelatinilytica]|uniref:hypothetical protein n=1 Tax=Xanthomarina gelatinilytica TaxID=1137281 RepID=UPI003A8A9DA3